MRSNMKSLAYAAMTAAIYYVLCVAIAPLSYGQVQCRISEVILLFCMDMIRYFCRTALRAELKYIA